MFKKKAQRKFKKNTKQTRKKHGGGGGNTLVGPLNQEYRIYPEVDPENPPMFGTSELLWTDTPISIPDKGTYIGEYFFEDGMPFMQGYGRLTSFDKNESNGYFDIYEGYWASDEKHGYFDFEYKNGDSGVANFLYDYPQKATGETTLSYYDNKDSREHNRWIDLNKSPRYYYHDGRFYEGELVVKNGRAVPANDTSRPRTIFNVVPGPTDFVNFSDEIVHDETAGEGFLMSDTIPPEPKVVSQGSRLKSRFSGIKELRQREEDEVQEPSQGSGLKSGISGISDIRSPKAKDQELAFVRSLTASERGIQSLEKKTPLPPISTKKGGNRRRRNKKTRKNGKK